MSRKVFAAVTAAGLCVAASSSVAQETATATAGGNVTADEATPLPPVVVQAPSEPLRRKTKRQATPASTSGPSIEPGSDLAGTVVDNGPAVAPFTLGQLDLIGGATITNEAMWTFNKNSLDQAVKLLPGATINNAGGARNEGDIYVRGFDRLRVPLYIDGVRINLPYDNRLDMSRFLTPDLAEVQVQKGYVSVLNGPGGMGGAINMVSRKPTKEYEFEGRSGVVMNGNIDDLNQWNSYAYAGTRQKGYYAQISGTIVDQDHFNLSGDFNPSPYATPGATGNVPLFPYENGGDRDFSSFQDWRVNAKVGITPNAIDEYTINYTYQSSQKESPLHVERQAVQGYFLGNNPRYWNWPQWDISTLSWLSKTQIGDASYIKTNAYYNTFDNVLEFFRQPTVASPTPFTTLLQDSPYADHSVGGFVEMGTELIPMNTLKGAVHYRRDVHTERARTYDANGDFSGYGAYTQQAEETWSLALENTFHATRQLDIVTGVGYDINQVIRADGTAFPLPELDEWNWQGAAIYSYSNDGKVHASVSSRVRMPTLFDRYSTRFGGRSEEPELGAERSTNYEIGISDRLFGGLRVSSALFYSDIEDTIQTSYAGANGNGSLVVYNADGENYGFELAADLDVTSAFRVGGNYTYLERDLDFRSAAAAITPPVTNAQRAAVAASQIEGTPRHSLFLYAAWKPMAQLTLTPSLEIATDRTALVTSCGSGLVVPPGAGVAESNHAKCQKTSATRLPNYVDIGSYALVNFQAEYVFNENATLTIGALNLLDEDYSLAEGFPQPGRQFFANARVRF